MADSILFNVAGLLVGLALIMVFIGTRHRMATFWVLYGLAMVTFAAWRLLP